MANWIRRNLPLAALLACGIAIAVGGYAIATAYSAVNEACKIQQRGLVAGQYLERFYVDYSKLLSFQQEKLKLAHQLRLEPPAQRAITEDAIAQINAYAAVVRSQPKHRSCP